MPEEEQHQPEHREPGVRGGWGERGTAPLELVLLALPLVLLVVFVLWAGRGGRAGLVSDLAAGEAAVVASLCCEDGAEGEEERNQVVADVLSARPGLGFLCIGGPRPSALEDDEKFVDEAWLESFDPEVRGATRGVGAVGVRFECETDGAVAPLRGSFPTVSFFGQAAEVVAIPPRPELKVGEGSGDEGDAGDAADKEIEFKFELTGPAAQDVHIYYWTADDPSPGAHGAAADVDYVSIPEGSAKPTTIAAGQVSAVGRVTVKRDDVYEHNETFELHWYMQPQEPCSADRPELSNLAKTGNLPADFDCKDDPGNPGGPQVPDVPGFDPKNYWKAEPAVGTILNDDPAPTLVVDNPRENEGDLMPFVVSLQGDTEVEVVVTVETQEQGSGVGEATSGVDYTPIDSTSHNHRITFPTGTTSRTVSVSTLPDNDGEPDETFELKATAHGHAKTGTPDGSGRYVAIGVGTILDDEPRISIKPPVARAEEGNPLVFTVLLDPAPSSGQQVTVDYGVGVGTFEPAGLPAGCTWGKADADDDYSADYSVDSPGTLTFNPGQTAKTIEVTTRDDRIDEHCWETFEVKLSDPSSNSHLENASAVGIIVDDDPKPTLTITGPPGPVDEGDPAEFTATLIGATIFPVSFDVKTSDGTAMQPGDYERLTKRITIPPGGPPETIPVQTWKDWYDDPDETFDLVVEGPVQNAVRASGSDPLTATATIRDATHDVRVFSNVRAAEGSPLEFTIELIHGDAGPIDKAENVYFKLDVPNTAAAATDGEDFKYEGPDFVTFVPGETLTHTVVVPTLFDTEDEPEEMLFLDLDTARLPVGFASSNPRGVGTITIVDPPKLSVRNDPRADEGSDLVFTVEIDKLPPSPWLTSFTVYTWALTATGGGVGDCGDGDYHGDIEGAGRTINFIDGQKEDTVTVKTCTDAYPEPDERFLLRLADPAYALIDNDKGVGIGTIQDVLPRVVFVTDADAVAGDEVGFEVRLTRRAVEKFTVYYWTEPKAGPATARATAEGAVGGDYSDANEGEVNRGQITFEVGDVSKIAKVKTWPDDELSDEVFQLEIALDPGAPVVLGDHIAEGKIKPRYSLLGIASAGAEEGQDMVFNVTRRGRTDQRSEVSWSTKDLAAGEHRAESGDSCGDACDYTAASGTLIFEKDDTAPKTITVETHEDLLDEWPSEQFLVRLHSPVNAALGASAAVGAINEKCANPADPSSEPPKIIVNDQEVDEGAGQATVAFEVFPAVCPDSPAEANYSVGLPVGLPAGQSAADDGSDYISYGGTVPVRGNRVLIDVAVLDDNLDEDDEAFGVAFLSWADPAHWTGAAVAAEVTILDDDGEPSVSVYPASAVEGQPVRFSVRLDGPSGQKVSVPYHTTTRSTATRPAHAPNDYTEIPESHLATLDFDPGDTEKFVEVVTFDDRRDEGDEEFLVVLGTPDGASVVDGSATGTIVDRTQPGLSITSNYETTATKASEDNEEVFTVTLDEAGDDAVTVEYETVALSGDGTATKDTDYTHTTGTLTFAANDNDPQTITVAILDDTDPEGDERFLVRLFDPKNAVIGDAVAATVIAGQCADPADDDHAPPELSVADASIDEDHPTGTMAFALTIDRPLCSPTAISVSLTHTDTDDADFGGTPAAAAYPDGVTAWVYQGIAVADDDLPEETETFEVSASWAAGPQTWQDAAAATATGTIEDDDNKAAISIAHAVGAEGTTLSFPVTLNRAARQPVEVGYEAIKNNSPGAQPAEPGDDFTAVPGTLTIPAGAVSGAIEVPALRDEDDGEPDETFLVQLRDPSSHAEIGVRTAVGTITDVPTPKLSVSNAEADEGQILEFQVTLDTEGAEPVKVEYTTVERSVGNAATAGVDFLATSGTLTFAPGETLKTVLVAALADDEPNEGDETLQLRLANPANADLGDPTGLGVIHNLGEPAISVADSRADEGQSVVFKISLSNRANQDITVSYAAASRFTAGDVAATPGDDYNAVTGTAIIAAGATEAYVAVATVDDRLDEYEEGFALTLTLRDGDYGTLDDASATATIEDNDDEPELAVADALALEDAGTIAATVSLDAPSGRTVAVDYVIASDTATLGEDYEAAEGVPLSGTLAIPAGRRSASLAVVLTDDEEEERAETLTVSLSNPRNATLDAADAAATLTIIDNEGPPTIYLDPHPDGSREGQPAQITLRLSVPSPNQVRVRYYTSPSGYNTPGHATRGDDYTRVGFTDLTLPPGVTERILQTATVDDNDPEPDETFDWVIISPRNAQLPRSTGAHRGRSLIVDDDAKPLVRVDDARAEEGGRAEFTIRLSAPASDTVTVAYRTEVDAFAGPAAATPGQDFTNTSGTATFNTGDQTATVQVALPDDAIDEGAETFWLRLDAETAVGADVADALAIGTIADNDPQPALSISDAAAAEGGAVWFVVALSEPSGRAVTVRYAPQPDTAAPPDRQAIPVDDYDPAAKTLVIPAGTTLAAAEVDVYDDQITEYRETFLVRLYNPSHATITEATARGTITDRTGLPQAAIADAEASENAGSIAVPVTLSHPSAQTVTFDYTARTAETDTATVGIDYTARTGTLEIPPGQTTATVDIPITDDDTTEPDETFTVELRNPQRATLIEHQATATIIDDDGLPRISIADAQAAEDDGAITLTVALSHPSDDTVTVDYTTFDNTATQPDDYTAKAGTLTFGAGTTTATITIPISDDLINEADETITVRLLNPTGATIRPTRAAAAATIADNDPTPVIRLLPAAAQEGQPLQFTAILDAPSGLIAQARYTTQTTGTGPGHAISNIDYTPARGTITIPPGDTTATISVTTLTDVRTETPETLQLALTDPQDTTLHPTSHTAAGTIHDNAPPTITIDSASALEGSPITFTIQLDRAAPTNVLVEFEVKPLDATQDLDYTVPAFTRVTIGAGQTFATLAIPTVADDVIEVDETFLVRLTSVISGFAAIQTGGAEGTILENALAPSLSVNDPGAAEGNRVSFTVTLTRDDNTADTEVSVAYRTEPLTASEGTDYAAATDRLVFPASGTTQRRTVRVATLQDELPEGSEMFQLVLHSPRGQAQIEDPLGLATIFDDESEPTLSIDAAEADEGMPLVFAATLNSPSGRRITADYRTRGVTAADGVDYLTTTGAFVFPPGTTRQTFIVATLPDRLVEEDETLEVVLSNIVGATPGSNGAGTIIDATRPAIRVADDAAAEGDPLEFVVTLNRQHDTAVTVDYATASSGTNPATASSDYTPASGTVTFPPGTTRRTVAVATLSDQDDETDETLTLTLSNPTGTARILDGTATGTIHNAARPVITVNSPLQAEGEEITFILRLSRPATEAITVDYTTADGTATGGTGLPRSGEAGWNDVDYQNASGTLTFAPGTTSRAVKVMLAPDYIDESTETFYLELDNAVNATLPTANYRATATILDTTPLPRFTFEEATSLDEETGLSVNDISISPISDRTVTVDWTVSEARQQELNPATAGVDFVAGSGTLTFPPGTSRRPINVTMIDDDIYEGTEYYRIALSNSVNAFLPFTGTDNQVVKQQFITDDESVIFSFADAAAAEDEDVVFTVQRSGRNLNAVGVRYETVDGSAKAGTDYVANSGTLIFAEDESAAEIKVETIGDSESESRESFTVRLTPLATSPTAIGILDNEATGTIIDTSLPLISLTGLGNIDQQYGLFGAEGTFYRFEVLLSSASGEPVTGSLELVDNTATFHTSRHLSDYAFNHQLLGGDLRRTTPFEFDPENALPKPYSIWLENDPTDEPNETFQIRLTGVVGAEMGAQDSLTVTIRDGDPPPEIQISDAAIAEGKPAKLTVELQPPAGQGRLITAFPVEVDYATVDGMAEAGTHYTATSGTLVFTPGEVRKTIEVPTVADGVFSGDRVFQVMLSDPVNATIGRAIGRVRMIEDDCIDPTAAGFVPPTLGISSASAEEGDVLSFEVSVDKQFCSDVAAAVSLSVALDDASSDDVNTPSATVGFKAGETRVMYMGVRTFEDSLDEPDEKVETTASWHPSLNLGATYSALSVKATGTIRDDDPAPMLEVLDATAAEAANLVFIVTLDAPSGKQVTVDYEIPRGVGTATVVDDYTAVSGTLTFAPGQTTKQVVVRSAADALDEHDEVFQLKLANPTNATIADGIAVGTIEDDDPLPVVSIAHKAADEDDGLQLTITLSAVSGRDVTVVYATADDDRDGATPATADDYKAETATARITAGNRTTTIDIEVNADNTPEDDETLFVKLLDATHATVHATNHTATATITNDD
ncbi:Calx-beta domain-containing protein [Candidatus Poriferisocius sp.]|uniref:Calx-beta domain-containing protein n=1 Tax=Candidatus Poriferisocius sp. TaxID=3101276 RepID=UPI003B027D89